MKKYTKRKLAIAVYDAVFDAVESFEHEDGVGPDLAYLLGAILKGDSVSLEHDRSILGILLQAFPELGHQVWKHIWINYPPKSGVWVRAKWAELESQLEEDR